MVKKMTVIAQAKKWGNSIGVILPKDVVNELQITSGDIVKLDVNRQGLGDGFGMLKGLKLKPFRRDREDRIDRWEREGLI